MLEARQVVSHRHLLIILIDLKPSLVPGGVRCRVALLEQVISDLRRATIYIGVDEVVAERNGTRASLSKLLNSSWLILGIIN